MALRVCLNCGNSHDPLMTITYGRLSGEFDCFACAINALAPRCTLCGQPVTEHVTVIDQDVYCGNCAALAQEMNRHTRLHT